MSYGRSILAPLLAAASLALIAGCGGSSKPAFCDNVSKLEQSVKNVNISEGLSSLKSQLQSIANQTKSVVSSAKSDFSTETTAMQNSLTKLETSIKSISPSPTPQQLSVVAGDAKALVDAVSNFASASKSKCQ